MLLRRSICFKIILVTLTYVSCQEYDAEYEALNDEGDQSEYNAEEQSGHPDYSKYFNAEGSAPIIQISGDKPEAGGFVTPLDFSAFFGGGSDFGFGQASNTKEVFKAKNPFVEEKNPTAGFVSVDDFRNGFAALASETFGTRDYYDSAQRKQQPQAQQKEDNEKDSYESRPGPSYISQKTPAKYALENPKPRKGYATEVHDLTERPPKTNKQKRPTSSESDEVYDYTNPVANEKPLYSSPYSSVPSLPINPGKIVDYNIGKSSSTVSQNPYNPGYYNLPVASASAAPLTPYQKYSFQPASSDYVSSILSTVAPFNPSYSKLASSVIPNIEYQASSSDPQLEKNKNCRKVDKQITAKDIKTGRFKRQAMNCFVCEDPKTKANYEQCSYSSEPTSKSGAYYASGSAQRYTVPTSNPDNFRFKREYKKSGEEDDYVDPYDYIKSQSQQYYSRPKAFDENKHYQPKDFSSEYRFSPEYFSQGSTPEKSFSEAKAEELVKNGENCQKVQRDEMTCVVCQSAETGGNYEQCSYTSAPEQQKYAYVREQKYDSNDSPKEKIVEGTQPVGVISEEKKPDSTNNKASVGSSRHPYESEFSHGKEYDYFKQNSEEEERKPESSNEESKKKSKDDDKAEKYDYSIPSHFEETTKQEKKGGRGLDPELYGSPESTENVEKTKEKSSYEYPDISEYNFKYFPDFLKEESQNAEVTTPDPTKKDVEEVLAEFAKKDRSQCKKAEKNGMTCYLCVDDKGLQHEECMYVSESKPKSTHVAYHEVEKKVNPNNDPTKVARAESKIVSAINPQDPSGFEPVAAASEAIIARIKYQAKGPHYRKRSVKENKKQKHPKKYSGKKTKDIVTSESKREEREEATEEEALQEDPTAKNSEEYEIEALEQRDSKRHEEYGEKERAEIEGQTEATEEQEEQVEQKEPETPDEFKVGEKDGAFSAETKPVYSKALGVTLPKYMLTKSESEAIFDEFVASG